MPPDERLNLRAWRCLSVTPRETTPASAPWPACVGDAHRSRQHRHYADNLRTMRQHVPQGSQPAGPERDYFGAAGNVVFRMVAAASMEPESSIAAIDQSPNCPRIEAPKKPPMFATELINAIPPATDRERASAKIRSPTPSHTAATCLWQSGSRAHVSETLRCLHSPLPPRCRTAAAG